MQAHELLINTHTLKKAALPFRALNNKLRMQILQLVHKKGRMVVTDIYTKLKIE
jgi:predicted transcriptional regulator